MRVDDVASNSQVTGCKFSIKKRGFKCESMTWRATARSQDAISMKKSGFRCVSMT